MVVLAFGFRCDLLNFLLIGRTLGMAGMGD